jgi:hypothetical protein
MSIRPLPALLLASLALPAAAQDGTGARIAPTRPEPVFRAAPAQPPGPLAAGIEDPTTLIRMAESALSARRGTEASNLLERAESRLLTRSELASEADRPAVGGAIGDLAAARDAIGRRDNAGASTLLSSALRRLESGEAPSVAALPAAPPPMLQPAPPAASPLAPPTTGASPGLAPAAGGGGFIPQPLPGITPQNMPVGGTASRPVPIGPDTDPMKAEPLPGSIPPTSTKPPPG